MNCSIPARCLTPHDRIPRRPPRLDPDVPPPRVRHLRRRISACTTRRTPPHPGVCAEQARRSTTRRAARSCSACSRSPWPRPAPTTLCHSSHTSAAAVHRLLTLSPDHRRVYVTTTDGRGGGIRSNRYVHQSTLRDDEVVSVDGVAVTSLARTAVDVATMGSFAQALTVFDSTLRRGRPDTTMHDSHRTATRSSSGPTTPSTSPTASRRASENRGVARKSLPLASPRTAMGPRHQWPRSIAATSVWARLVAEFDGKISTAAFAPERTSPMSSCARKRAKTTSGRPAT